MSVSLIRGLGFVAPVMLVAQAAHADLSAQEVWSDWKDYMSSTGYEVTASEDLSGNTLTVSDIKMSMDIEGDSFGMTMGTLEFVENGDGTVNVVMPGEFPMAFDINAEGEAVTGTLLYTHDGSPMVVSGDASEMEYSYSAATGAITLADLEIDGEAVPSDIAALTINVTDLDSNTVMKIGDVRAYTQSMTMAALAYDFMFQDPDSDDGAKIDGAMQGLEFTGDVTVPDIADPTDVAAMLKAGMAYTGTFTFESGNSNVKGADGSDTFEMQTSSQGGTFDIGLSPDGLAYDVTQTDTTLNLMGSDIPFPIALSMEELGVNFAMPLTKSDEEQDFALGLALREFAVPEMLWGLIDPTGELPHDPATLVVDMSGTGKLFFDLVDEEQMAVVESGEEAPGELNSVTINEVLLSAAGAELTGTGAFTFDNSDLESFDGMPAPSGEANLKLVGANTLIDKLIGMGLMSEDDAMGARMMMGMFAVPAGDDTLTSKIEVNDDGHVLANGQRLK
ncbi:MULTISPECIES: DUF2125 domain-containing protein [unclassified Epibacterium]|uniref:DUF2125 domain-containing protein n=1 Tax=unclassified Epibacterium TaxID=2639179 RepID=UPI001EF6D497|nr:MULTISPECIES: DUF2125 domain-containing protein [unclassified Epibacterium]MCG7625529.1 DUF2125 domain-containing protein [Epibacterium sp. Ofav1-8]MCG7629784.1 DUF2125 domain-containing protein [Epibacterium sp. MM17-32]